MNPEDFYKAKRERIFQGDMIFCLATLFIVVVGSLIVYLILKFW